MNPADLPPASEELCRQVRRDILRMTHGAASGHPGGSLGCTEVMVSLFFGHMQHRPRVFDLPGHHQDVFYLSNGHISPVYYSVLARSGYFPVAELASFRKLNSRLQGHPSPHEGLEGVRVATGSLGQGLSVAVGHAASKRLLADPTRVYCLMGDGEAQEGQVWEAANFAAFHGIDNLVAIMDLNFKQIDGDTREVQETQPMAAKWSAFGWQVLEGFEGNRLEAVQEYLKQATAALGQGKPVMLLLHTTMGQGVDFMEHDYRWHGVAPNSAELERALAQLPITSFGDYPA